MAINQKIWTQAEIDYLIKYRADGFTHSVIAKKLGRSRNSVSIKAQDLVSKGSIEPRDYKTLNARIGEVAQLGIEDTRNFNEFFRFNGDFISVSDVHVPFYNKTLLEYILRLGKKFKIHYLVINGDFLNLDSFSRFATGFKGEDNTEKEFTTADQYLAKCLQVFNRVIITQGNHEERLFKNLLGQVRHSRFFRMFNTEITAELNDKKRRVSVSGYTYCIVNNTWLVGHPESYSDRGGQTPADLADKYNYNVICGHNHQFGVQMSKNGKYIGIDQGMGADELKIEYVNRYLAKNRKWQNGFTMVRNNYPYVFNLRFTDWNYWLK